MANLTGPSQLDSTGIPTGSLKVPGVTALKAIQGGNVFTDSLGDDSAPIRAEAAGSSKATYTYAISATAPYATPKDWVVIRGSATKTVKIVHIEFSGVATAATAGLYFTINKHTVANTGGTSTSPTPIKHDSNDGAATATVLLYTVVPTIDATATIWKTGRILLGLVAPAAGTWQPQTYVYDYGNAPYEPLTLRGVAQECAINFNTVALISGEVLDYAITWTEE